MATMLVCMCIGKLLYPEVLPTTQDSLYSIALGLRVRLEELVKSRQLRETTKKKLEEIIVKALEFCRVVNEKFPMVYSTLELGTTWAEIGLKLLGLYQEERHEGSGTLGHHDLVYSYWGPQAPIAHHI